MSTEKQNPLDILQSKVREAHAAAKSELDRIRRERSTHDANPPAIPTKEDAIAFSGLQTEHQIRSSSLRETERNFDKNLFVELRLSDLALKPLLSDGLTHVKKLHAEYERRNPAIRGKQDKPVSLELCPVPTGGLFGKTPKISIASRLAVLEADIEGFPDRHTFEVVTGALVTIANELKPEAKPVQAKRVPFSVDIGVGGRATALPHLNFG